LRCSTFVHSQNVEWLEDLFAWAVAIQAAEAHFLAESLAIRLSADIDTSVHPKNGARETPDEMLGLIQFLTNPCAKETRAFTKEDFKTAANIRPASWVMANAGDDGLTAEFPFPGCVPPTALFTAQNNVTHPQLGVGLLLLLRLPMFCTSNEADAFAMKLNSGELVDKTRAHFMGGWCVDSQRNESLIETGLMSEERQLPTAVINERASRTLSFCAFLPSVVHQPSVFPNLVFSMAHRARWASEFLSSQLGPRDRYSYNAQREQHTSSIESLFRRVMLQPKRKPS
jgi:hypothetical protein